MGFHLQLDVRNRRGEEEGSDWETKPPSAYGGNACFFTLRDPPLLTASSRRKLGKRKYSKPSSSSCHLNCRTRVLSETSFCWGRRRKSGQCNTLLHRKRLTGLLLLSSHREPSLPRLLAKKKISKLLSMTLQKERVGVKETVTRRERRRKHERPHTRLQSPLSSSSPAVGSWQGRLSTISSGLRHADRSLSLFLFPFLQLSTGTETEDGEGGEKSTRKGRSSGARERGRHTGVL